MNLPRFSTYALTALILIGLAVFIMVVLVFTNRGDLTSATLLLIAFSSFLAGLFIFSFSREEKIVPDVAAAMAIPYTKTLSRVLIDLGVSGHAHFIPVTDNNTFPASVMQFNPISTNVPDQISEDFTFLTQQDSSGVLTVPSGIPLLNMMEQSHSVIIPTTEPELYEAIRQANEDLLEVAGEVIVNRSGNEIVMELKNFWLIEACRKARAKAFQNCIMAPCPVCSLAGIMVTKGLGKTSFMQQVLVDDEAGKVEVYIGLME